jgi:hypothetical protein
MQGRSLSCQFDRLELPLDRMKAAGHAVGGKLNDAFVGGVLLGIRRYHRELGSPLHSVRMAMPINVRDAQADGPATSGNSWVPARFEIGAHSDDPRTLMEEAHRTLLAIVHEPALSLVDPLSNVLNRFPATVTTQIFGSMMRGLDVQASNVPGTPVPLHLAGRKVEAVFPFGPMAGAGANVTTISYCGGLDVGINVDPAAVTEPATFSHCLKEAWNDVMELAD